MEVKEDKSWKCWLIHQSFLLYKDNICNYLIYSKNKSKENIDVGEHKVNARMKFR
jgi:hypothetical protein